MNVGKSKVMRYSWMEMGSNAYDSKRRNVRGSGLFKACWNDNRWPHQKTSTLDDVIARNGT